MAPSSTPNGFFLIDDMAILDELSAVGDLRTAIETLPNIRPDQLDLSIQLYGVVAGSDGDRVLFVRRTNPQLAHGAGKKLFAIGGERLTRLDEPAFSFAPKFDFVVGDGWAIVLDQRSFEMLYREIGMVTANITRWIGGITDFLPMDAADVESLRDRRPARLAHLAAAPRDRAARPPRRCHPRSGRALRARSSASTRRQWSPAIGSRSTRRSGSPSCTCSTRTSTRVS